MNEIIQEILIKRPTDKWLHDKLEELEEEYGKLLDDHHRLVKDNSKLRTTIHRLRAGLE
jgi:hypothetical protein